MPEALSIIIVDDMHFSRAVIEQALKQAGYDDIRVASSGDEVLDMLEQRVADVLLADWVMPGMSGLELTEAVRQKGETQDWYTSIILFTAKEGEAAVEEAFRRGIDDFINKPVRPYELLARVYSAGRIARLHNELLTQSMALRTIHAHQEPLITQDLLTGLNNRRQLRQHLQASLRQTQTRGGSNCLAIIDIDNLAEVNDEYGHEAGDQVLITLANRLKRQLRPLDFISRHQGGAYAVVLHSENAVLSYERILRRLLDTLSQRAVPSPAGLLQISCSAGAWCCTKGGHIKSANEFEQLALQELEAAKPAGRKSLLVGRS